MDDDVVLLLCYHSDDNDDGGCLSVTSTHHTSFTECKQTNILVTVTLDPSPGAVV